MRVIFVPGLMGSELLTPNGNKIWPNSIGLLSGIFRSGGIAARLENILDTTAVPGEIVRQVGPKGIYNYIVDRLAKCCEVISKKYPKTPVEFEVFTYDWRKPIAGSSFLLAREIIDVDEPAVLIGHSMGGILIRQISGYVPHNLIKKTVTIASPLHGAPKSLAYLLGLEGVQFVDRSAFQKMLLHGKMPSIFDLLCPPGVNSSNFSDMNFSISKYAYGDILHRCLNEARGEGLNKIVELMDYHFGFAPLNSQTQSALDVTIGASGHDTLENIVFEDRSLTQGHARYGDMAGDNTVPLWSAMDKRAVKLSRLGSHDGILHDQGVTDFLCRLIESEVIATDREISAPHKPVASKFAALNPTLSANSTNAIADPAHFIRLMLSFDTPTSDVNGKVLVQAYRVEAGEDETDIWAEDGEPEVIPIHYHGMPTDRLYLRYQNPANPGFRLFSFKPEEGAPIQGDFVTFSRNNEAEIYREPLT